MDENFYSLPINKRKEYFLRASYLKDNGYIKDRSLEDITNDLFINDKNNPFDKIINGLIR